jgi:hypothetical protein
MQVVAAVVITRGTHGTILLPQILISNHLPLFVFADQNLSSGTGPRDLWLVTPHGSTRWTCQRIATSLQIDRGHATEHPSLRDGSS